MGKEVRIRMVIIKVNGRNKTDLMHAGLSRLPVSTSSECERKFEKQIVSSKFRSSQTTYTSIFLKMQYNNLMWRVVGWGHPLPFA